VQAGIFQHTFGPARCIPQRFHLTLLTAADYNQNRLFSGDRAMCQMRVMMESTAGSEQIMEDVTALEVTSEGVVLASLFEESRLIAGAAVKKIDFMATVVTLCAKVSARHG
jgi:predicted RNA-binding protein